MTMETYTLVVRETETHDGIDADIRNADGLATASTRVTYADYDLQAERNDGGDGGPEPIEEEFTADVLSLSVDLARVDGEFAFRVVGDDRELARATVTDEDWGLTEAE